jgi:hypothetical protein
MRMMRKLSKLQVLLEREFANQFQMLPCLKMTMTLRKMNHSMTKVVPRAVMKMKKWMTMMMFQWLMMI